MLPGLTCEGSSSSQSVFPAVGGKKNNKKMTKQDTHPIIAVRTV